MSRRPWKSLLVALLLLSLVAAACASSDSGETFQEIGSGLGGDGGGQTEQPGDPVTDVTTAASEGGEESPDEARDPGESSTPVVLASKNFGRDIIFTADMTVAVPDVSSSSTEATRVIEGMGGFLFGQQTTGGANPKSVLTFKIDPEGFQEALAALGSIGEVRTQNVSANDVTERVVDLQSRIETAVTSVSRLRGLLDEATDIKEIVALENELLARETQLETLRGELRTLQNQVALATIVLTLTEADANPAIELSVTAYPGHDDGVGCPGDEGLSVESGSEATVCFEIINAGDTMLTDFELTDPVLDVDNEDLIVVFGDLEMTIEPGESLVVAADVEVERTLRTRTTVTARPVGEDGTTLGERMATQTTSVYLEAVDPGGIPTFSQGLETSWEWLVSLGQVLLLVGGAMLPFLWIPLLLWVVWRTRRNRPEQVPAPAEAGDHRAQ